MRVRRSSPRMTLGLAVTIWRMSLYDFHQHQIAAELNLNQGRISEVLTRKRFPEAEALALKGV